MGSEFEKLNEKFNTESFDLEISNVSDKLKEVQEKKNELYQEFNDKKEVGFTREDQCYLIDKNKMLLDMNEEVLIKLKNDIKIGTPPKYHEVFSFLINSQVNVLKELRELYRTIRDVNIIDGVEPNNNNNKKDENVEMTATDFLKLIKEAQKTSSLNSVDASFEVIDDKKV
jgi:hypothetical protein